MLKMKSVDNCDSERTVIEVGRDGKNALTFTIYDELDLMLSVNTCVFDRDQIAELNKQLSAWLNSAPSTPSKFSGKI